MRTLGDPVLRQGTLYKPPRDGKPGMMRARHFTLHPRSLEWFADSACMRPRGSIELTPDTHVVVEVQRLRLSLESRGHRLTLCTRPPWYAELFKAREPAGGSRFVLEAWQRSICAAIDATRLRPPVAIATPVAFPTSVIAVSTARGGGHSGCASTPPPTAESHLAPATVDLNAASAAELAALPGIGAQRAAAIVEHRRAHGHFRVVDDLDAVRGVGPSTVSKLRAAAHCGGGGTPGDVQRPTPPLPTPPLPTPSRPTPPRPTPPAAPATAVCPRAAAHTTAGQPVAAPPCGPRLRWEHGRAARLRWEHGRAARPRFEEHAHTPLFFPDHRLPCEHYLACTSCLAPRCRLAHHETGLTRLLRVVGEAERTIDVAVYCISLDLLASALLQAHARGVRVRVVTDDEQLKASGAEVARLEVGGVAVRTDSSPRLHMHHKFVVVDSAVLLCGSFNFTRGAATGNCENALISRVPSLARRFATEFERLWAAFGTPGGPAGVAPACDGYEDGAAVFFFPSAAGGAQTRWMIEALLGARERIDVAVFTLTHDGLVDALIAAHRSGIAVRVITDNRQARVTGADAPRLREAGVAVRTDSSYYAMHHKFCVIDGGALLLSGSFNWTSQAAKGNQENLVIYRQQPAGGGSSGGGESGSAEVSASPGPAFALEFERLWAKFAPKASQGAQAT